MRLMYKAAHDFNPDAIITCGTTVSECLAIAQKFCVPLFLAVNTPFAATAQISPPSLSAKSFEFGFLNKALHWGTNLMQWGFIGGTINKFRKELSLPSQTEVVYKDLPQFFTVSELVVKRPTDWPNNIHQTSYWIRHPDEDYAPPK